MTIIAPSFSSPAASERARIAAILTSPDEQGRTQFARHLAFHTNISAPAALAILATAPKAAAAPATRRAAAAASGEMSQSEAAASWSDAIDAVNARYDPAGARRRNQ